MTRGSQHWGDLLGDSDPIRRVKEIARKVAPTDCTILITGETGTGKEVVANYIHALSPRSAKPLICVNCSAIPDTLLESELFGFERGAFTGAVARQEGMLKRADNSTIFLDEIGDMSLTAQAKLLRAIEGREVQPLGGAAAAKVNFRVVAATHHDLQKLSIARTFREDLFFRLSVVPLRLPPLRERRLDIPVLVQRFIQELNIRQGRNVEGVSVAGLKLLVAQDWPGNVRQLRNVVEHAFVLCQTNWIGPAELTFLNWSAANTGCVTSMLDSTTPRASLSGPSSEQVRKALIATQWNKSKAAQLLNMSRMTVYRMMAKYSIGETPQSGSPENDEEAPTAPARVLELVRQPVEPPCVSMRISARK